MRHCRLSAGVFAVLAFGCTSQIEAPPGDTGAVATSSGGNASTGPGAAGPNSTASTTGAGGGTVAGDPAIVTRVARLTHAQYNATVQDLLGITDNIAAAFAPDALNGFEFDTSVDFRVDARLGPQYRSAAEALSERVVSDAAVFARVVPCSDDASGCADDFIQSFGMHAFRRPLTEAERAGFAMLFEQGATLVSSGDAFRDGVRLVVEAMLQSPQFIYRTELSDTANADGLIPLDGFEVASRLAYFLHGSMPSDELLARASRGELQTSEQLVSAVELLLSSERATAQLVAFHAQAWDFSRFSRIAPDMASYPAAPPNMVESVRVASERYVQEVIDTGGGLSELLTSPYAYADAGLAPLYGSRVEGALTRLDFAPSERKGYLMQVGFLASHAYAVSTDPIHRGLFVLRQLLCQTIPDPPAGASMASLPETNEPIETTREEVELLTGQVSCVNCHQHINPPGFALEGFDAAGQVRATENGVAVDTSGSMLLDGVDVAFSGALELVDALAASSEARACYAAKWLEFAYGRALSAGDLAAAQTLGSAPLSVHQLVAQVTTTSAFTHRKTNQVAP